MAKLKTFLTKRVGFFVNHVDVELSWLEIKLFQDHFKSLGAG
ncbi:hypothetical protein PGH45_12935 [Legionella pneumophila]|nr:hypothetical protein [Legionella pneumophila]